MTDVVTLEQLMTTMVDNRVCRLCRHAYFSEAEDVGLCKHEVNAKGTWPKLIGELGSCPMWEEKEKTE